jgi:PIN domain nuclease of toxin-antitoxin system
MKYLLDTNSAIWALTDSPKLSKSAKAIMKDVTNSLCVSIVSAWEIAIKVSINKLDFEGGSARFLKEMQENGIDILNVEGNHVEFVESLPFIHRDPFDRLLIATAKTDDMTILTSDVDIQKYDVSWIW